MLIQRGVFHGCKLCLISPGSRRASSLANSVFTSFFFHNAQWLNSRPLAKSSRGIAKAFPTTPTSLPISAYKPAEILTPARLMNVYAQLSKSRLSFLMVLTAMTGVALSPLPTTVPILLSTAIGTALCSASANTLNQLQEIPFDAQMARTRTRPLVRRAITPTHAAGFAAVTGIAGPTILWTMVNPITAVLGAGNIILYAGVYTWMKRRSVANTWVGSVVGAIPPLMGWTASGGKLLPNPSYPIEVFLPPIFSSSSLPPVDISLIDNPLAPWTFFMLLFSWQFPHFNSLSYLVRGSYAQAGYQMLSVLDPAKNALVSLRHAALLIPVCSVLVPLSGMTTWMFAFTSMVPNVILATAAWRFWRNGGEKEARTLWHHSLWYLPAVMGLMMVHKQGVDWLQVVGIQKAEGQQDIEKSINTS